MNLSLRQVQFFCTVADTLHFGRAADLLFVSQSMVSQEVRRLETALGVKLFDRSTRRVRLTGEGTDLLPAARVLIEAASEFANIGALLTSTRSRSITIAASPSAMNELVPQVLRLAEDALPDLHLDDLAVETGDVIAALDRGDADIGIGRFLETGLAHRVEVVRSERLYAALSAAHPLAAAPDIVLGDLADLPLLLWSRERNFRYYDELIQACAEDGLDPLVLVSQPRIIGSRSYLIAENRAFGLLPESTARVPAAGISVVPLRSGHSVPLEMAWSTSDPRESTARVLDLIRRAVRPTGHPGE